MNKFNACITALLCLATFNASASLVIRPKAMQGHQHDRRAPKVFSITGHQGSEALMLTPDLRQQPLEIADGKVKFKPTGKDNYHALIIKRLHKGVQETAIRYIYSFGKPTGFSPAELVAYKKSALEIVPDPLPREHWHYKAGHKAAFIIKFKDKPLATAEVSLSTSNASMLKATTDSHGRVVFTLPDDFAQTRAGNQANKPGEMLLHVKHKNAEQRHATWLSADYRVDPSHWRDTQLGAMVATAGFVVGALFTGLGFRQKDKLNKKRNNNGGES